MTNTWARGFRLAVGTPVRMIDASGAAQDASSTALTRQEVLALLSPIIPEHARHRLPQEAIAIETAETGHLVFGALHTTIAASTVNRVIDQFPQEQQAQIRIMLSESLKGLIAQNLCRKIGGGRIAALEMLLITSAISNLIREAKTFQIPSMMQVGRAQGMVALNEAFLKAVDKAGFEGLLKRAGLDTKFVQDAAG